MKRAITVILFCVFSFSGLFCQETQRKIPIIGCAGLWWESPIEDYQRFYPQSMESQRLSQPEKGIRVFSQETIRYGGLDSMEISFSQGRLFRVSIAYAKRDMATIRSLLNNFISTYGKFDTYSTDRSISEMDVQDFTRYFREDLTIRVSVIEEMGYDDITITFLYTNPKIIP